MGAVPRAHRHQGTFEAELTVDDEGMVAAYSVWQRTGFAVGLDDTEPLDAHR